MVICDENAQSPMYHVWPAVVLAEKVLLTGDTKQLGPQINVLRGFAYAHVA